MATGWHGLRGLYMLQKWDDDVVRSLLGASRRAKSQVVMPWSQIVPVDKGVRVHVRPGKPWEETDLVLDRSNYCEGLTGGGARNTLREKRRKGCARVCVSAWDQDLRDSGGRSPSRQSGSKTRVAATGWIWQHVWNSANASRSRSVASRGVPLTPQ